jgi:hypothetical protein
MNPRASKTSNLSSACLNISICKEQRGKHVFFSSPLTFFVLGIRTPEGGYLHSPRSYLPTYLIMQPFTVMTVANGMLLLTILLRSSLRVRKEMLIIAGMAGADVIYGLGVFMLAIYRFILYANQDQNTLVSAWSCITPMVMTYMGIQLSSVMNVVVSSDRLMAVAWPAKYHKLDVRYAGKILASAVSV